jgi:hypothetical protein
MAIKNLVAGQKGQGVPNRRKIESRRRSFSSLFNILRGCTQGFCGHHNLKTSSLDT